MLKSTRLLLAVPLAAGLLLAPVAQAGARDWHGHRDWHGRDWRGGWHGGGGNAAAAAILGGLVGLGVGAAIASQQPAYAPPPVAYPPYGYGGPGYYGYPPPY